MSNKKLFNEIFKYGQGIANNDREVPIFDAQPEQLEVMFDNDPYELAKTLAMLVNGVYTITDLKQDYEYRLRSGKLKISRLK